MANGKSTALSAEDRILWSRVSSTVRPLPGKIVERIEPASDGIQASGMDHEPPPRPARSPQDAKTSRTPPPPPPPHPQHAIDRVTRRKISAGRLPIDARIDLHGLGQAEAHAMLFTFLHRAQAEGCRVVLVITGKGASFGSDGILRRAVPTWLQTPQFRALVSGFDHAGRGHGGEGALYARLRTKGRTQ